MNRKYILLISGLITLISSSIISVVPIGFYNQAEVSAFLPTLFTPDTSTFRIWGLIYLSFLALGIYQIFIKNNFRAENIYLLVGAQIISSLWLIPSQCLWIGMSLIIMSWILFLLTLCLINSQKEDKYFRYTVELFFGWILVAFIANIHIYLVAENLYFLPEILTYISILAGLGINIFLIMKCKIYIPAIIFMWATIGIILGQGDVVTQLLCVISIFSIIASYVYNYKSKIK